VPAIDVWQAQLDERGWPGTECLPRYERERAGEMLRGADAGRWAASRWVLRGVLGRYLAEDPERIELRIAERGKPALADPAVELRFNLSHSGDLAVVAFSGELEVGVDVEWVRPRKDLLALARRALPAEEAAAVAAGPPEARLTIFHAAWTRREAVAKCLGVGIAAPLPDARVAVSQLDLAPGYAAAIAVTGDGVPPLRRFGLSPADL
jgi:4'-phosphopantetheinyl transferase